MDLIAKFPRSSPLNGITLKEPVDENLLEKCIHCDLLVAEYKDNKWFKTEKQQLQKFREYVKHNIASVTYSFKDDYSFGRVNPVKSMGLHCITRQTRHTLVFYKMVDIDIENCHLIILLQVLKYNLYTGSYSMIEDYVINRQQWIDSIASHYNITENKKDVVSSYRPP